MSWHDDMTWWHVMTRWHDMMAGHDMKYHDAKKIHIRYDVICLWYDIHHKHRRYFCFLWISLFLQLQREYRWKMQLLSRLTSPHQRTHSKSAPMNGKRWWFVWLGSSSSPLLLLGLSFKVLLSPYPRYSKSSLGGIATTATMLGWLTFIVFAAASFSQLVVGKMLDTHGPRQVFIWVA